MTPEQFWAKVDQTGGPDACWPWMGARQTKKRSGVGGYGYFTILRRHVYAHRKVLELTLGRSLAAGEVARHSCDNPPCCNPAHLSIGTTAENNADIYQRDRRYYGTAEYTCPDCGLTHTDRRALPRVPRCPDCAALARKAKRRRAYVAWRDRRVPA